MIICLQTIFTIVVLLLTLRWLLRKIKVGNYGNKYVFITGCDSGFGNLLAKRLDDLGFHVFAACLTDKGAKQLKSESSERLSTLLLDVTSENSIHNAREYVESQLPKDKGLWAIVNNAGTVGGAGPLEWVTAAEIRRGVEVNLFGVIFVTKEFLPLIRRERRGRVVNMASMLGRFGFAAGTAYVSSKFGVEGFSDQLRRELYRARISVHIIEPGFFQTELFNLDNSKQLLMGSFRKAPTEVQRYYGESFVQEAAGSIGNIAKIVSHDTFKVVDAYEHAITAKYPKARYVVGNDANYFFRLMWNLPEWLSDYIVCRESPIPEGAK